MRMLRTSVMAWYSDGPLRPSFRALRPVQVVSLLDTVLILEAELCWWELFSLVGMAVFNGFRTYVLIDYLFFLSNRRFILSLSTVLVHLPFSNNCRCHGVLALVRIHPTAHPQVLSPDGSFEDVLNRSKVRYNVNIGFLIFPKKSYLRAELSSIVRWGLTSPQRCRLES